MRSCCAPKAAAPCAALSYTLAETPAGVGGTLSPVVTSAATAGRATNGSSVATNALELGVLAAPQTNLSMQGRHSAIHRNHRARLRSGGGRIVELDPPDYTGGELPDR